MQDGIFNAYVMDHSRYNAIITERLHAYVCLSQRWEPENYTVEIANMEPDRLWELLMKASEPPKDVSAAVANQVLRSQEFPAVGDWEKFAIKLKMAVTQQSGNDKAVISNLAIRMTQSKDTVYRAVGQAVMANGDGVESVDHLSELVIAKRHSHEMQTNLEAGTLVARLGGLEVSRTNFTTLNKMVQNTYDVSTPSLSLLAKSNIKVDSAEAENRVAIVDSGCGAAAIAPRTTDVENFRATPHMYVSGIGANQVVVEGQGAMGGLDTSVVPSAPAILIAPQIIASKFGWNYRFTGKNGKWTMRAGDRTIRGTLQKDNLIYLSEGELDKLKEATKSESGDLEKGSSPLSEIIPVKYEEHINSNGTKAPEMAVYHKIRRRKSSNKKNRRRSANGGDHNKVFDKSFNWRDTSAPQDEQTQQTSIAVKKIQKPAIFAVVRGTQANMAADEETIDINAENDFSKILTDGGTPDGEADEEINSRAEIGIESDSEDDDGSREENCMEEANGSKILMEALINARKVTQMMEKGKPQRKRGKTFVRNGVKGNRFLAMMGFPRSKTRKDIIQSGADVELHSSNFVDDVRGSQPRTYGAKSASRQQPPAYVGFTQCLDFIPHQDGTCTLIAVEALEGLTLCRFLPNKMVHEVAKAAISMADELAALTEGGQPVRRQCYDAEPVCATDIYRDQLTAAGIEVVIRDPGYHEKRAEKEVQTIKKMGSLIKTQIMWKMQKVPRGEHLLIHHCTCALAHTPKAGGRGITPYQVSTGRTRTWHTICRDEFGAVVYAKRTTGEERLARQRGDPSGGELGILLGFADLMGTGRYFMSFRTGRVVVRRDFERINAANAAKTIPFEWLRDIGSAGFRMALSLSEQLDLPEDFKRGSIAVKQYQKTHPGTKVQRKTSSLWKRTSESGDSGESSTTEEGSIPSSDKEIAKSGVEEEIEEMRAVAELGVGEDVAVRYGGGNDLFPARVITNYPTENRMDVRFFEGRECKKVPYAWVVTKTPRELRRFTGREASRRLNKSCLWQQLGESEGAANEEWTRQSQQMQQIDNSRCGNIVEGSNPSLEIECNVAVLGNNASVSPSACTEPVDEEAETNSGSIMLPSVSPDVRVIIIPDRDNAPKYLVKDDTGEVHWGVLDDPEGEQKVGDEKIKCFITLNQRSAYKAVNPDCERSKEAIEAINTEIEQFKRNGVLSSPVSWEDIPEQCKGTTMRCFNFVVDKYDSGMAFIKCKARMVVDGSKQHQATYDRTESPTLSVASAKFLLQHAALKGEKVASTDIVGAFTLTPMKHEVYIELPKGPYRERFGRYTQVLRCLYGMKQASREFFKLFHECLLSGGFEQCLHDPALYKKKDDNGNIIMKWVCSSMTH
tara:strand:+ start:15 stop:4094 length:4080 start_codon:yes stop_codon:yes gene_type:complete